MKHSQPDLKHIAIIAPIPPPNGGMALQGLQLKRLLENEGYTIFYTATNPKMTPNWISQIPYLRAVYRLYFYCWALFKIPDEYQLWHIFSNSGLSWFLFSLPPVFIAKLRRKDVIINYRGGGADQFLKRWCFAVKQVIIWTNGLIVPSDYLKSIFAKYQIEARVVPNVIDETKFYPRTHSNFQTLNTKAEIVLSITRNLEPIYGVDVAIKSFFEAKKLIPQLKLKIAGEGVAFQDLKRIVQNLGLENDVDFLGRLSQSEMLNLYQTTDLLINPSLVDNMPNSLLEAMACALPIITSNAGGIPYMVDHLKSAWIVPAGDINLLTEAIIKLIQNDTLRLTMAETAFKQSRIYFWPQVKERWAQIYRTGCS
ncbi:MAG: glycosyltransferase family 4 protein [Gammaproteobacteria bacterium]